MVYKHPNPPVCLRHLGIDCTTEQYYAISVVIFEASGLGCGRWNVWSWVNW